MYQILGYYNGAVNATLYADIPAVTSGESSFSARGGTGGVAHWIFTEDYDLRALAFGATTVTAAQLFDSTLNAINIPQLYPPILGIVPPSNPNLMDWRMNPQPLPKNEEIALQASAGAGGAEKVWGLIWITPSSQGDLRDNMNKATLAMPRVYALVTVTLTLTAGVWSPFGTLVFTNPLKGGAYQINGAYFVVPTSIAYKLNFVKAPLVQGRKLFPGNLVENAYGNVPLKHGINWMGPMGRFNNFELPQVSVLATTSAGSATYTGYVDMTYLGNVNADAMP
jgi:hypothetical protein